jgi:hypothetical protein
MYVVEGCMKQTRGRVFKLRSSNEEVMKRPQRYPPDTPTGEGRACRHAMMAIMARVVASTGHWLRPWLTCAKEKVE